MVVHGGIRTDLRPSNYDFSDFIQSIIIANDEADLTDVDIGSLCDLRQNWYSRR